MQGVVMSTVLLVLILHFFIQKNEIVCVYAVKME